MTSVFIPQVGNKYRLLQDWKPMLSWASRNLVLFRNLKLTSTKQVSIGSYYEYDTTTSQYKRDETGKYIVKENIVNRTVPNPLFKNDEGEFTPVMITFPEGIVMELTCFKTGYNNVIREVWFKITDASDKRFKDRVLSVSVDELNGAEMEQVE